MCIRCGALISENRVSRSQDDTRLADHPANAADLSEGLGLETTAPSDAAGVLLARSHGINFRIQLVLPQESAPSVYWEVHCRAQFSIPRERVADLLAEVNGKAWLVKTCELPVSEKGTECVVFSYGFNLAGGVTPHHLKSQIFEWLENVRRLWFDWGRPVAPRTEAQDRAVETVHRVSSRTNRAEIAQASA